MYLAKVSALIVLFYLVYVFLLKPDTYHNFKRGFLLFGLVISLSLPFITYMSYIEVVAKTNRIPSIEKDIVIPNSLSQKSSDQLILEKQDIEWGNVLLYMYLGISLTLMSVLIFKYVNLIFSLRKIKFNRERNLKYYTVNHLKSPFSFFNHIVLDTKDFNSQNRQMVIEHEKIHASHYHSLDMLFINLFTVIFWINPVVWLYRREIKQNLEHIADHYALKTINDSKAYQFLMLQHVLEASSTQLQTYFFQPSIKQRIIMINKTKTSTYYAFKSIVLMPLLLLFFINFQTEIVAKEVPEKTKDNNKTIFTPKHIDSQNNTQNSDKLHHVVIKIDKHADLEYLQKVKNYLKSTYDVKVTYHQTEFDEQNQLIRIDLSVENSNGSISNKTIYSGPIDDFFIYGSVKHEMNPFFYITDKVKKYQNSTIISPASKNQLNSDVTKTAHENKKDISKVNKNDLINTRIIVKINAYAESEYLEYVKSYLMTNHDIKITYNDLRYNDDGLLTGINLDVQTKDGFSGSLGQIMNKPLGDIYVYRDYSEGAKSVFGVGDFPAEFDTSTNEGSISSIQLSPNEEYYLQSRNDISTHLELDDINTYIINGKRFKAQDVGNAIVMVDDYSILNNSTLKIKGEVIRGKELEQIRQSGGKISIELRNKSLISFYEGQKPTAMVLNQTPDDVTRRMEENLNKPKVYTPENPLEIDLTTVKQFTINGKVLKSKDIPEMVIIPSSYQIFGNGDFRIDGEELVNEDLEDFFKTKDKRYKGQVIFYVGHNTQPYFVKVSKSQPKRDKFISKTTE